MRPALELALTYAPSTGAIDVTAYGGRKLREAVARAFAEEMLASHEAIDPVQLRHYVLNKLARPISFPTDPKDGIEATRLLLLRLDLDHPGNRLTLEVSKQAPQSVHGLARDLFGPHEPLAHDPRITKATLLIRFARCPGRPRGRSVRVELTAPNGCNLCDRSEEERLVGEKYLRRWGLLQNV